MRSHVFGSAVRPLAIFAALSLLAGCKSSSFVGKKYDNFTAYYNTFYNAQRSYKNGVENQERQDAVIDRTRYIGVFIRTQSAAGGGREFEDAVVKSADVLREHPDSKWVDDALLLIGKAYFYQANYVGAQQKFLEAIAQDTGVGEEARFWLARTLVAGGDFAGAEEVIAEALAGEVTGDRWVSGLRLVRGELRVKQGDWERAAEDLVAGLENVRDDEIGARAQYLTGQVLETLGRYEEAVTAYRRTNDFRPRYELTYAAQYSAIRVEGRYVDAESALNRLRRMERDDKHFTYRAELAVLRGQILQEIGLADDAYNVYDELLYDPAWNTQVGQLRGRIHYSLGELYRDLDEDYVAASAHFDTSAAAIRVGASSTGGPVDPLTLAPEAISNAQELKEAFGAYARAWGEVYRMDSLLWLGQMDDSTFSAKILELRQQRAEELAERQREQEARQIERAFQGSALPGGQARGLPEGKIIPSRNAQGGQSGFLFHDDPVMRQEGELSFTIKWGERPRVPNWRRMDAVSGIDLTTLPEEDEEDLTLSPDQLPEIDTSPVPRDSLSQATMLADRSRARYDVGTSLFLGVGRPDSAASWFRMVIDEVPEDDPLSRRALFALAEIQRALGDSVAANSLYQRIVAEWPESEFAGRIRTILGLPSADVVPDSMALAETEYTTHFDRWGAGEYTLAMNGMVETAGRYWSTEIVPRALLAAGSIFLEWADQDSLDIMAPMPIEVEDSLLVLTGLVVPPVAAEPDSIAISPDSSMAVPPDSSLVPPDSSLVPPDSSLVPPDSSLVVPPDSSLVVPPDSSVVVPPDASVVVPPDSSVVVPLDSSVVVPLDASVVVPPDASVVVSPDSSMVPPDSSVVVPPDSSAVVPTDSSITDSGDPPSLGPAHASVADSTLGTTDPHEEPEPEPVRDWREVKLDELLRHLTTTYGGTRYAVVAGDILGAIESIAAEEAARLDLIAAVEKARLDSIAAVEAARLDSIATADSLTLAALAAAADSARAAELGYAGGNTDSLAVAAAGPDSLRAAVVDSLAGQALADTSLAEGAEITADSLAQAREPDSALAIAEPAAADSVAAPEGDVPDKAAVPDPTAEASPDSAAAVRAPIGMAGARQVSLADDLREVESDAIEPLVLPEEEGELWSGWTVVLGTFSGIAQAEEALVNLRGQLDGRTDLEIWVGSWRRTEGVIVSLGRFDSSTAAREIAGSLGARLPADAWLLHIVN